MLVEWLVLGVFLIYFIVGHGIWSMIKFKKMGTSRVQEVGIKKQLYTQTMISNWIPALILIGLFCHGTFSLKAMGLKGVVLHAYKWLSIPIAVLSVLIMAFFIYQTIALRIIVRKGKTIEIKLTESLKALLPEARSEKVLWIGVALTAGITEELLFRGYLMYALESLIPGLGVVGALIASSLVFGVMHLYQGVPDAAKTATIGLLYGVVTIALGSVLPGMMLHFIQDLSSIDVLTVQQKEVKPQL
jgi:membrane protease YdiL (CAAX protease family)